VSAPTSTAPSGYGNPSSGDSSDQSASGESTSSANAGYGDNGSSEKQPAGY
jgi:hypothetical protein